MMEQDFQANEAIDRYLRGELEGEALHAMEQRILADTSFARQVEQRKQALLVIAVAGREALRGKLKQMHRELERSDSGKRKGRRRWMFISAAAAILLLAIPVYLLLPQDSPATSGQLFEQYFDPGQDRSFSGSRESEDPEFARALTELRNGNCLAASPTLRDRAARYPDSLYLRLCNGVCYLGTGQTVDARKEMEAVLKRGETNFRPPALWYLGLAELHEGKVEEARLKFEQLAREEPQNHYRQAALELLEKLEPLK